MIEKFRSADSASSVEQSCRLVEVQNVGDDDYNTAKPFAADVPNDLEDRFADLKKATR